MELADGSRQGEREENGIDYELYCCRRVLVRDGNRVVCTVSQCTGHRVCQAWVSQSIEHFDHSHDRFPSFLALISFDRDFRVKQIEARAFAGSALESIFIPWSVEVIGSSCFELCEALSSIIFESGSKLTRIESYAFSSSGIETVLIPRNVEILGPSCFSSCDTLFSIRFEPDSRLNRIESYAFAFSSLESVVIPRNVRFIEGSVFIMSRVDSVDLEPGQVVLVNSDNLLIDTATHTVIRNFSTARHLVIGRNVEILGSWCFASCKMLSFVSFESDSRLRRIEHGAFTGSSLQTIVIPRTVEVLGELCFESCEALSSLSFEEGSRLDRIEAQACQARSLHSVLIPPFVSFIASNAFRAECNLCASESDRSPELARWCATGRSVDFRN
jgi:hypothetical protein